MISLTDSHCHLASTRFDPDEVAALLERANAAGVNRIISLSTSLLDVERNIALASHPSVYACIGIHPCDVHEAPDDAVSKLAQWSADCRVCGIGETGLDYYHPAPEGWNELDFRERQRRMLRQHFDLAVAAQLNVVIHTRDQEGYASLDDALQIYSEYHTQVRAVFHCFIGSWENAQRILALGGLVSFGGVVTFKNAHAARDAARRCPIGSLMIETDAPYLAPEPHRGRRNEPSFLRSTAETLSQIRGESLVELAMHTQATASSFFRFRSNSDCISGAFGDISVVKPSFSPTL